MRSVLSVGGNSRETAMPPEFADWDVVVLDIDPRGKPDIVLDARRLDTLPARNFDAVYCSHNLEHYYLHDARKVVAGFRHVIKDDGFLCVRVPDVEAVMRTMVENKLDIDAVLYHAAAGPITARDVIYGYQPEIEQSGNDFYAHKNGFTRDSLVQLLQSGGFQWVVSTRNNLELTAIAFAFGPSPYAIELLKLPV